MSKNLTHEIITYIETVLASAQIGLTYSQDKYDIERFRALQRLSAELLAKLDEVDVEKVSRWIDLDENYATPKIDTRSMIYDDAGRILLVRERVDGKWTLPGGWCDVGDSPSESAVLEVQEETGLIVEPLRLVALYDKHKHPHPPQIPHAYKLFFHCRVTGGEIIQVTDETLGCDYFPLDDLPEISTDRNTPEQIITLTEHIRSGNEATLFD